MRLQNKINNSLLKKKLAFTLAEVLIVISIIGIVAEIVIPDIVADVFDSYSLAMVKEDYSILQQSIKIVETNNGTSFSDCYIGGNSLDAATDAVTSIIAANLKIAKDCGRNPGCFSPNGYKYLADGFNGLHSPLNLDDAATFSMNKMILANGSSLGIVVKSLILGPAPSYSLYQVDFFVDVNGLKGPNRLGYDTFLFRIFNRQAFGPWWAPNNNQNNDKGCYSATIGFTGQGYGCAGWAVYYNTVKYKNGEILP